LPDASDNALPRRGPGARLILAAGIVAMTLWQLVLHLRIIMFAYPLDYRENTDFYRALLVAAGRNLYDRKSLPFSHGQYGFVFDYLAAPLVLLLGPGLAPTRLLTALAIILTSLLMALYAQRRTGDRLLAFAVFALVYVSSFSHPGIFLGFPNALGVFFFLLSVMLPILGGFSAGALAAGIVAALFGFYTKLYFGFGPAFLVAYLLVVRAWSKAAWLALASIITLTISLWLVSRIFPFYFDSTIRIVGAYPAWDGMWLLVQSIYFLVLQAPLLAFLVWRFWHLPPGRRLALAMGFSGVAAALAVVLLIKLGGNPLQYYLYFYQLLFPFLLLLALDSAGDTAPSRYNLLICLAANIAVMLFLARQHTPLASVADSFAKIEARFPKDGISHVLLDAPASYYAIAQGQVPVDQGQTEFLKDVIGTPHALYLAEIAAVEARKRAGFYSLVITDDWQVNRNHDDLRRCYIPTGRQDLWFYQLSIPAQFWTRKAC
jgi:hypothetical protein